MQSDTSKGTSLPILVEATTAVLANVFSPDSSQSAQTLGGGNIANDSNNDHWWGLQDGHSLYNFLLVDL